MKELQFKNCTESYKIDVDGVKIKPYLTVKELYSTYYDMKSMVENKETKEMSKKDALDRHFTKIVNMMKYCTNIDFSELKDEDVYDICAELGFITEFEINIEEYRLLDRMIERDENTYNALTSVTESLAEMMKGVNPEQAVKELEGVLSNVNK